MGACRRGHEAIASLILKTTTSKSICISHQNKKGQTPLHLAAPLGMIDVVETLLTKGASITAVDSKGNSPPLACAANEDVAMCLAMILSVFLATPANSIARRSICSLSSLRLSDSSFSTRLSEMGLGLGDRKGSSSDATFTVDGNINMSSGSLDRSQTNSLAVDEPSILPNAFSSADNSSLTSSSEAAVVVTSSSSALTPTAAVTATSVIKKAAVVGATGHAADVNHNTSNGVAPSASGVSEENGSLE